MIDMEREAFLRRRTFRRKMGYILIGLLIAWIGYLLGGVITVLISGKTGSDKMGVVQNVLRNPFGNYINSVSAVCMIAFLLIYICVAASSYYTKRMRITQSAYGTSQWEDPIRVTRELTKGESPENNSEKVKSAASQPAKIFSQSLKISYDGDFTHLNNNTFVCGGPGKGKSLFFLIPNLLRMTSSFIVTDPKGQLLYLVGNFLRKAGYRVLSLNLVDFLKSDRFNPFRYVRSIEDLLIMIDMFISTTTPQNAMSNDPYWEKAEAKLLKVVMKYQYLYLPEKMKNLPTTIELLSQIYINKDGSPCRFTEQHIDVLAGRADDGEDIDRSIIDDYRKLIVNGPEETVRCVLECLDARMEFLKSPEILRILSDDDMDIADIGNGIHGDPNKKTAVFCVTSDVYTTYNPIASLFYMQCFKELYWQADHLHHGKLPIEVGFWLDEFISVALPKNFLNYLSTCRSRNISMNIIVQNIPQLKGLYKDSWGQIIGSCSTFLYLGGNEPETYKMVSEMLGKGTYSKESWSKSGGLLDGKTSRNEDMIGRELLDAAETRKMNYNNCIIFVEGYNPIIDKKYVIFKSSIYNEAKKLAGYHIPLATLQHRKEDSGLMPGSIQTITAAEAEYYKQEATNGAVEYYHVNADGRIQKGVPSGQAITMRSLSTLMQEYTVEQQIYVTTLLSLGVREAEVIRFLTPDMDIDMMALIGEELLKCIEPENLILRYSNPAVQNLVSELLFELNIPVSIVYDTLQPDMDWDYQTALNQIGALMNAYGVKTTKKRKKAES